MATMAEQRGARVAEEIRMHGAVRPPWIVLPDVHPYDIAWRMGSGEDHLMLWGQWSSGRPCAEIVVVLSRWGAVPADWAWWAAEACGLVVAPEGDLEMADEIPFEEVRAKLATVAIAVSGSPAV